MTKIKFALMLMSFMIILSSKKCKTGDPGPSPSSQNATVDMTNIWTAQYPQASTCTGSGPRIGNNPRFNSGVCNSYSETNKRFTEVSIRRISDNSEFDRVCWGQNNGANSVTVKIPTSGAYEIKFKQYDGCSTACFTVCGNNGCKGVRLIWEFSKTYTGPASIMTVAPAHNPSTGYSICN